MQFVIVMVALVAAMGGFIYGFDSGMYMRELVPLLKY